MIELNAHKISEPQLLAVFICLNLYNFTYTNVRFLLVSITHVAVTGRKQVVGVIIEIQTEDCQ